MEINLYLQRELKFSQEKKIFLTNFNFEIMRKRDFLLAGALLAGLSLNAQETMFFYGFEDGGADTIIVDSITHAVAYDKAIGARDTLIYLRSPSFNINNEGDSYEVVKDLNGTIDPITGQGGQYYLKVQTGTVEDSPTYQRVVKIRNIPVLDETSYRLTFYMKTDGNAHTFASMQRGIEYCDKNFVTKSNTQFTYDQSDYNPEKWIRRTSMYYYINDSIQEKHCSDNFWWAGTWEAWGGKIYQPDKYIAAISMYTKGKTYFLDDISLVRSTIGGAEFNGDLIRIDFGYDTNLSDIAAATTFKAVAIDNSLVSVTAGEVPLEVIYTEYHADGYMYIWVGTDVSEYEDTVRVSFTNPKDNADLALKYTASLRPHTLDTTWEKTKFVDDFSSEIVLFNDQITAVPISELAPSFISSVPDAGSFNLDYNTVNTFTVTFNKEVFIHPTSGVVAYLQKGGYEEALTLFSNSINKEVITFKRATATALDGDYILLIRNAKAGPYGDGDAAAEIKISLTFGTSAATMAPVYYVTNQFAKLAGRIEAGWNVEADNATRVGDATYIEDKAEGTSYSSGCRLMKFGSASEIKGGMYLSGRGASIGYLRFGDGDSLFTLQAGEYWISYALAGWGGNKAPITFKMYKRGEPATLILTQTTTPKATNGASGANLVGVDKLKLTANIIAAGDYVLEWSVSGGYGGQSVIGDVEVTNVYSNAYIYTTKFNESFAAAQAKQTTAQAQTKYSGADLTKFNTLITKYNGWSHTSPTVYTAASDELKAGTAAMQVRITNVDAFYTKFDVIYKLDTTYRAPHDYSGLAAYLSLHDSVAKYNAFDITAVDSAALVAINANLDATAKVLNDRMAAISAFNVNCNKATDLFNLYTGTLYAEFDAYKTLQTAYNANFGIDVIAAASDDIAAASSAILSAYNLANGYIEGVIVQLSQIESLMALVYGFDADWSSVVITKAEIDAKKAATITDDQDFAELLKLAAKKAIYDKIASTGEIDTLDLTGFIRNSILYSTARLDVEVEKYWYDYASKDKWRLKLNSDFTNVFPGWTVRATSGNLHVGNGDTGTYATDEKPAFSAHLAFDWSTGVSMTQEVTGLPAGVYTIGIGYNCGVKNAGNYFYADNDTARHGDSYVTSQALPAAPNLFIENAELADTVLLGFKQINVNSWAYVDNFSLQLTGKSDTFDYAAAATQAAADLNDAIESRINAVEGETSVQYFNLNGVEISSPQVGINIKVTVNADGSRKIEKILVK